MESSFSYQDRHTASIDLSNKCREFYNKRMLQAEQARKTLSPSGTPGKSSVHRAMERLSQEMSTLMDQDLSLMRQLLLLNEAIEDLKTSRANSSCGSSRNFSDSELSVSDTEMYESDRDLSKDCESPISLTSQDRFVFPDMMTSQPSEPIPASLSCRDLGLLDSSYDSGCEINGPNSP